MKILFYATSPNQTIGYAKVGSYISNYLAQFSNITFYYFATGNFENTMRPERFIHPSIIFIDVNKEERDRNITEDWGVQLIEDVMLEIKPDIFLIYNDLIVTCRLFNSLLDYRQKYSHITKFVSYIDLVYPFEKIEYLKHLDNNTDLIYVFSDCWKENLIKVGINPEKIRIFYHGIEDKFISLSPSDISRKHLQIDKDDFVILNTNRNCYRKAIDITISAFLKFLKDENMNKNIKLFLNMYLHTKAGYDLLNVVLTECIKQNINFEQAQFHILTPKPDITGRVSDEMMNHIYNSCDVGINTAIGEGFGLCNFEHAYLGKPQIVSAVGGLKDIFSNDFSYVVEPIITFSTPNTMDGHNGDISYCDYKDVAEGMKFYYHNRDKLKEHGQLVRLHIMKKYNLDSILNNFGVSLNEFFHRNSTKYYTTNYSK